MRLHGKRAIITGAAGGLGTAIARKFAKEGADLCLSDVNLSALEAVKETLEGEFGRKVVICKGDVSKKRDVVEMVEQAVKEWGTVDILVNNAGGSLHTPKNLDEIEEEHWDLVLDVNLKGTFFCSQAVAPHMIKNKKGSIINMASIGGRTASIVTGVHYAAAKGGVISFTRRLAKELGVHGIRVNAVAPGTVITGERMRALWNQMSEQEQASVLEAIPLGRLSTAEEQADVIAYLASDESSYITGTTIDVNGGRFMA